MLYDFISESVSLQEQELLEDKMVKFGGELSPKFGWCVIYVGGPASGKGSATSFLSRLQGRYYNVDDFKENPNRWNLINPATERPYKDDFDTPERNRTESNPEFMGELHGVYKPLTNKLKKHIIDNPEKDFRASDRLPNIIFDITGDELRKLKDIIEPAKEQGYKIAIIWMLSTIEKAIYNNLHRNRKVDNDMLVAKHGDVISAIEQLFNSDYISKVDDFWVIDTAIEINPKDNPKEYHDAANVYHIPSNPDGLQEFEHIASRIDYNKKTLQKY